MDLSSSPALGPASDPGGRPDPGPLVSVIVPAFNAEATLERTLGSIAAQDYARLEILIVDDGSTDSTTEIAERFCAGEPRAKLIRKDNGGVAVARNLGIGQALGDYVAPIDADDLWHPAKISRQVAAALAAPEPPGFVYCWFRDIDEAGNIWGDGAALAVEGPALQRLAYRNFVGNGSAPLIARTALVEVGGYDERLRVLGAEGCEDLLVQFRLAQLHPVALVPEYLVGYRLVSGSMSGDPERMFRSWRLSMELLEATRTLLRRPLRWGEGYRTLALAETRAMRGEIGSAFRLLGRALRLDPARTGLTLLLRTARHLVRRAAPRRAALRAFEEQGAAGPSPATDRWLRALARFDQHRLDRIARLERS